jgi:uncharacterized membrane protein YfcA
MELIDFIIVAVCGFGIGMLSGMFGIGGGGMIVPLLHMAFGLPMVTATSTSLLTIAPTGISGSIKHLRLKTASLKTGLVIGGFGVVASIGGSLVADRLPEYLVVILTVLVILFSVGMMLRTLLQKGGLEQAAPHEKGKAPEDELGTTLQSLHASTGHESGGKGEGRREGETDTAAEQATENASTTENADTTATTSASKQKAGSNSLLLPLLIGFIAGGIAGIVGVGGGFIIVPFCVAYLGFSLKKAAGTSLIAISLIAIPGIITHALLGHISWLYGIAIMLGTIPGAQLGAWIIDRLPERPVRFAFAALLTVIGILMLTQEFVL